MGVERERLGLERGRDGDGMGVERKVGGKGEKGEKDGDQGWKKGVRGRSGLEKKEGGEGGDGEGWNVLSFAPDHVLYNMGSGIRSGQFSISGLFIFFFLGTLID